jgi:hypothetical protein
MSVTFLIISIGQAQFFILTDIKPCLKAKKIVFLHLPMIFLPENKFLHNHTVLIRLMLNVMVSLVTVFLFFRVLSLVISSACISGAKVLCRPGKTQQQQQMLFWQLGPHSPQQIKEKENT